MNTARGVGGVVEAVFPFDGDSAKGLLSLSVGERLEVVAGDTHRQGWLCCRRPGAASGAAVGYVPEAFVKIVVAVAADSVAHPAAAPPAATPPTTAPPAQARVPAPYPAPVIGSWRAVAEACSGSAEDNALEVAAGSVVQVLDASDAAWLFCRVADGHEGYVPRQATQALPTRAVRSSSVGDENSHQLAVAEGEQVHVLQTYDSGWALVAKDGHRQHGYVPSSSLAAPDADRNDADCNDAAAPVPETAEAGAFEAEEETKGEASRSSAAANIDAFRTKLLAVPPPPSSSTAPLSPPPPPSAVDHTFMHLILGKLV